MRRQAVKNKQKIVKKDSQQEIRITNTIFWNGSCNIIIRGGATKFIFTQKVNIAFIFTFYIHFFRFTPRSFNTIQYKDKDKDKDIKDKDNKDKDTKDNDYKDKDKDNKENDKEVASHNYFPAFRTFFFFLGGLKILEESIHYGARAVKIKQLRCVG